MRGFLLAIAFLACSLSGAACGDEMAASVGTGSTTDTSSGGGGAGGNGGDVTTNAGGAGAAGGTGGAGGSGAGGSGGSATVTPLSQRHRYIDGGMFGGWGPHLGHLVRAAPSSGSGTTLWFVDDYCTQSAADGAVCDVLNNHTLGYFELSAGQWVERQVVSIPGTVQQNTATIVADDGSIYTYGIDVAAGTIVECVYLPATGPAGCAPLPPFSIGVSSNYVGAAVSPQGYRLVWWTNVVDGGNGAFHFIIDYGGGWNGPRSGSAGGYNDAAYINIAFGGDYTTDFTMHAQMVSGLAPNWNFHGLVGNCNLNTGEPVAWSNPLAPPSGDEVASTNDIWTDAVTGDTHLLARLKSGAAAYYHRPKNGAWSGVIRAETAYRARWLVTPERRINMEGKRSLARSSLWASVTSSRRLATAIGSGSGHYAIGVYAKDK